MFSLFCHDALVTLSAPVPPSGVQERKVVEHSEKQHEDQVFVAVVVVVVLLFMFWIFKEKFEVLF